MKIDPMECIEIVEKGNYRLRNWYLQEECTGNGWAQKTGHKPCHSILKLLDGSILRRISQGKAYYGFICPECKCFTELSEEFIPTDVKEYCIEIATPGTNEYGSLTDEGKEISDAYL